MNKKAQITLEFNKILQQLASLASTEDGQKKCLNLQPLNDINKIEKMQSQTADAFTRSLKGGRLSFSGIKNLDSEYKRLEIGASLSAAELLKFAALLEASKKAKHYSYDANGNEINDSLKSYFANLEPHETILKEIQRCILSEEEIADDASSNLKTIRKNMSGINDRIHSRLNEMLSNQSVRSYLQDAVITMRGDRYCLPVKSEYRSHVPGQIRDQSSTGSTVFIEPDSVIKLNNEFREYLVQEAEEIDKILASLSASLALELDSVKNNYELICRLDFIFARAELAARHNATRPKFSKNRDILIKKGRHPLLDSDKVVPIDLPLERSFNQLIITGPNTGGKTVTLKTLGLFVLMGQSGLHIPASDGSILPVFKQIYADIGDEQSIEQSLSTFSSHMKNIIYILKNADENSLVLFDELCAGTDPTEGAALAISILTYLNNKNVRTLATTHYSEIKLYALNSEGVENACCEFDVETLSPTYRLLIGIPGKSNAFAISKKLGLPENIISEAQKHLSDEDTAFEDIISDLETKRVQLSDKELEISKLHKDAQELKDKTYAKYEKIDTQRENIINEAKAEAARILKEAKDKADEAIRNINKYGSDADAVKKLEKERSELRDKIKKSNTVLSKKDSQNRKVNHPEAKDLHIGDTVMVLSLNMKGTVHTLPNARGKLDVQMGILKYNVGINDLILLNEPDETTKKYSSKGSYSSGMRMSKTATVKTEINLIGLNSDDAIAELDKYLDDAYIAHLPQVRVVHGKGSGILRNAVSGYLKRQSYVKSFQLGEHGEGDAGVTIVNLDV